VFCLSPFCLSPFGLSQVDLFCLIPFCLSQRSRLRAVSTRGFLARFRARDGNDGCVTVPN
jgi:hypothetical protein